MRRTGWFAIALLLSLAAAGYFAARWREAAARVERLERLSVEPVRQRVLLDRIEIARLEKLGLSDPVDAIRSDLSARGNLIPFPGVLGGTMSFYDKSGMVLLPGGYVYAPGDDGHYLVHAVLRYEVAPGGKILWKLVDARKD